MAEWNDWSAENLRRVSESLKDANGFDIITERSRGAIYRGGESEEGYTTVYYRTMMAWIVFLVFLYILGSLGFSF